MNEEALQYSFELFANDGYEGTIEEYKELLKNDQEALDYSYDLFSKDGYDGERPEYNKLIGAVQEDTQDFPTAVATETAPVTADATAEDTELALVDTSLESQSNAPFVINGQPATEQEFNEYKKDLAERDVLEKDESFFSATGFVDFFSDVATAAEEGWRQGELIDPAFELYSLGDKATDEDVLDFVNKNKEIARKNLGSAEMQEFNKIYEESGGGFWGFIKGVVQNPSTLSTMLVSSISSQISSLRSDEVRAAGAAAAATGAVAGSAIPLPGISTLGGAVAGAMGGTMGAMETGLTFAELLQEEAGGLDPDKIKKILQDPEKLADLKNRALNRGVAIAAVEMATLGIAKGVGGKLATAGFKRAPMVAAGVTGAVEIAGGGLGEVAGRYVAGQEMDAAEIGFEAFAGLGSAPLTLGKQALNIQTNLDRVKINKEINKTDYGNIVDVFKPETKTDDVEVKVSKIKNSYKILNEQVNAQVKNAKITKEEGDAIKKNFITTQGNVNRNKTLNLSEENEVKIIELQKERGKLENQIKEVNDKALTTEQSTRVEAINNELTTVIKSNTETRFNKRTKAAIELATDLKFKQEPKVLETTEDYIKEIADNYYNGNIEKATEASNGSNGAFIGKGVIFINKETALKQGSVGVANHEILHPILNAVIGDIKQQRAVLVDFKNQLNKTQLDWVQGQLDTNVDIKNHDAEFLTYFSEGIINNQIKYDETVFTKLKDVVVKVFKKLGYSNIKFDTGKDVYNFLKEYNNSILKDDKVSSEVVEAIRNREIKKGVKASEVGTVSDISLSKTTQEQVDTLQEELDNLDEYDFTDEIEYDQAVANLENKIRTVKRKETLAKREVKKEVKEKVVADKKTFDNEGLVETIKSKETTRKEKSNAETELLESFDALALKAIKYDTRKGDYDRTEIRDYLRQFLPGIIDRYDSSESKFSTYVTNTIAPKAQQTYERFRKIADRSLDVTAGELGSVKETAAEESTSTQENISKPSRKIKPIELIRNLGLQKKYKEAVKKIVEGGKALVDGNTFGNLKDLAAEVTAEIFDIPLLKVTDPADNLAFKDVIVDASNISKIKVYYPDAKIGMVIKSESSKIQDIIKSMGPDLFKLLPPENVAPELATVDAQAYKGVKGTGLKIPSSLMKAFYEATGKRSKGVTSQVIIKKLKPGLTYEQFLKELGIVKGQPNTYDRAIGQRLKAITTLFGKLATNTEVRQLEGVTDVQVQNIAAGKSDIQFSSVKNVLTKEALDLLVKNGINDKYNGFRSDFITDSNGGVTNPDIDNYINDIVRLTKVFNTDDFKIFNSTVLQFTAKSLKDKAKRNYLRDELAKLRKYKILEAKLEVGRTPFAKFLGNNVTTIEEKTLSNPDRLKDYNEKHRKVFLKMWEKINTILSNPNTRDLALPIAYFLENAINERSNPMSMGALAVAFPVKKGRVIWDHAFPQTQAARFLLDSILDKNKSFKKALKRVDENYYAIALTKSDQKKIDDAKSSNNLNENERWYDRLLTAGVDLSKYTYFGPEGELDISLAKHVRNLQQGKTSSSFSKTVVNQDTMYDLGLQPSSNQESLLEIQFSKNKRKEYEDILSKKRPELKNIPYQVDELFKWADGLKVKDDKKSKYKKLALYYTANGYTIFPEDGYKIEEVLRLANKNKIDPYAYANPDELINKFTKEDTTKKINPDNVEEFTNKRTFPKGVTVYDVDDSKAGQRAVRGVVDSNWGKEANPWCLIARDDPKNSIEDQQYGEFTNQAEADEFADRYRNLGYNVEIGAFERNLVVNGKPTPGFLIEVFADLTKPYDEVNNMEGAWSMWKNYNKSGYGYEIAFQNGKLISFRDGGNRIIDDYDVEEVELTWWDRFDKPTDTLQINLGKENGLTKIGEIYFNESQPQGEVELVGYGEGDFMSRKDTYKLYNDSKELTEAKVYKDGKISELVKNTPTKINDGGRAVQTTTNKYDNGEVVYTENIIKDLRTGKIVTKSTTSFERLTKTDYIVNTITVGVNGKSPNLPKVTEKNIRLIEEIETGLNESTEYYAERITDGVSDVVIDRMSELNKIKESSIQFSKSIEKATKSNNDMLPKSKRLKGDFTMDQVLDEMKSLDDQQTEAGIQFSNSQNLDKDFNDILEKKSGIASDKEYKRVKAEVIGASKGRFNFFIPPSAEDFVGLLYATLGKNKTGDAQMAWYKKNLLNPFARAMENISRDRNSLGRDFKALKKTLKIVPKNLKKKLPGEPFTTEQAVRVWIWNQIGKDVPGLDDADVKTLVDYVNSRPDLQSFGTEIMKLNKGTAYTSPTDSWNTGTITTDLLETLNTTKRKEYLELWQQNVDIVFSEKNLNKLEAIYGKQYRKAMENILSRMKTGKNRVTGSDSLTTRVTDWLTGSIGAIMFFNTRSAVLQTLSAVNFINFGDNNILAAGKAFANQKQYWTDFKKLFNSEFLIERRDGLKMNVNEADIADIAKEKGVRGVINKLLKLGFTPTQLADSFAIASGGSTFYRNRLNALVKEGMNTQAAEKQAMSDFREIAEESQQSSRPDKISQQQAGPLGRIVLAFANTPAQYARLIKKAASDLKNGRGDAKTNISKIIYYGVAQNLIFNALQNALDLTAFGEDEEEDEEKIISIGNGMADSLLRGLGVGGAIVSTVKNAGLKLAKENAKKNPKYEEVAIELLKISPPVASKIGKVRAAGRSYSWDKKEMKEKGWSLDNPAYLANANIISAASNIPLDRVIKKIDNITASTGANLSFMQRVALLAGWSEWQLGIDKDDKKTKSKKGRTINKRVINKRVVNKRTIN